MAYSILASAWDTTAATGVALLLDALIKGIIVLLCVGIVAFAMRRSSAAMRHLVWTVGLLSLLLMPLISLAVPRWEVLPEWLRAESIVSMLDARSSEQATKSTRNQPVPPTRPQVATGSEESANLLQHEFGAAIEGSPTFHSDVASDVVQRQEEVRPAPAGTWLEAGISIWAVVAAVLLLRIVLSRIILARVVKTASRIDDGPIHSQIVNAQRRYNIHCKVHTFASGKRALPMTWGLVRTHILLPADAAHWPARRLEAVLLHELAHVKRCDTITHVVGQITCALYWINPLVWLAAWRLHVERECACDDLVVGSGVKSSDYAEHLLHIIGKCRNRRSVPCSAVAMAKPSRLEGRLVAILNDRLNRRSATKGFFAAVLVAGCVGVISVAMLQAQSHPDALDSGEADPQQERGDQNAAVESAKSNAAIGTTHPQAERLISHVNTFLAAALSERYDEAAKLAGPEIPSSQFDDFKRLSVDSLTVETLYIDSADALAITSPLPVDDARGKRAGRLVLTWNQRAALRKGDIEVGANVKEGEILGDIETTWQLRDVDLETDETLQREIARFLEDFPDAVRVDARSAVTRRFVRLVIGPDDKMTFEGRATTWQQLATALAKVPHRASTVLEYAISTEQLTVAQLKDVKFRAAVLAKEHGFEYASYVGVHPLGSLGSKAEVRSDGKTDGKTSSNDPPIKFGDPNEKVQTLLSEIWPHDEQVSPIMLVKPAEEAFDSVAQLAGMTANEAHVLDTMLRGESFDGFAALKKYDPATFAGDAATLKTALEKVFALQTRQAAVLKRIDDMLDSEEISDVKRQLLQQLRTTIQRQRATNVLSVRQVFRQFPASGKGANWSALVRRRFDDDEHYMALVRSPVGGEFPVHFGGEKTERFRVRVLSGDDDALTVKVFFQIEDVTIEPIEQQFRVVRDETVEIEVNGDRFSLLYPSVYIARSGPATTDLAHFIVSYRAVERDKDTQGAVQGPYETSRQDAD